MSRTRHRRVDRSNKRTLRSRLTKGKSAGEYSPSIIDKPANRGLSGSWLLWLHSYNGYGKQRKRRRIRKWLKTYGRRVCRRSQYDEVLGAEAVV
jgi:hypothetical protein